MKWNQSEIQKAKKMINDIRRMTDKNLLMMLKLLIKEVDLRKEGKHINYNTDIDE